jgi:ABC-type antimicrobial peptide transport system permease subunit
MLKNYFITALRNFRRNKAFTLINVLGLSVGISAALVIFLIVRYDLSFESFQHDKDRIYRVVTLTHLPDSQLPNSGVPYPLPAAANAALTGIDGTAAFFTEAAGKATIPSTNGARPAIYKEQKGIIMADSNYFRLFPFYKWLAGSPANAFKQPFQTVISTGRASLYFPGLTPEQIIGKTIVYTDSVTCTVTGIVETPTANTDFTFQEFISLSTIGRTSLKQYVDPDWGGVTSASQFFVRLSPNTRPEQIEHQLLLLREEHTGEKSDNPNHTTHILQPLGDIHFNARYDAFGERIARKPTLYGLLLIAIFLLVLGCINFINLSTAQGTQRAKEIGVRKTMGGSRQQIIIQFLSEAFLLTFASTLLSLIITPQLLHIFSGFIPSGLHFDLLHQTQLHLFLAILVPVVSGLAGFYPALILSGYQPIIVLKNQAYTANTTSRKAWTRKTLTVFQFVIAQVFIMSTLIVSRQIHYAMNKDMGLRREAIVFAYTPFWTPDKAAKQKLLLDRLKTIPGIETAAGGGMPPAMEGSMSMGFKYSNGKKDIETNVELKIGDSSYNIVYGLKLLAGRYIHPTDTLHELIINQTYARILGFQQPKDAIGKLVNADHNSYPIVGVMADFNQASIRTTVKPLVIGSNNEALMYVHIALRPQLSGSWKTSLAAIGKAYSDVYPDQDYQYTFFDQSIAQFYKTEQNISRLLTWATGLTIFISCLGLLGLVIYSTRQRTKEIGIRKVLGASVLQIVSILSKDFVKLVGLAFLVAMPLAWYATNKWLEQFAYRADPGWWIFPLSGLAMIVIALLTLSIRTIQAANANPAGSLRSE